MRLKNLASDVVGVFLLVRKSSTGADKPIIDWEKFSSFPKLLRIAAYVLRFIPRNAPLRLSDRIVTESSELKLAEAKLLQLSQIVSFPAEIKLLDSDKPVKNSSGLFSIHRIKGSFALNWSHSASC